ncbi:hypothetical protein CHU95_06345 [Niveispirillum lacus]|uniref:Uncharacterized protein n=1 Tax=Niveispirillum lacus TaxID=1981099 RepID=A0A255Z374_9PROT|nr:hypothetical protein [Niveispirillum lacus]OYQ35881.1 hypothetical protein CHU95_06345 [Niveispirillum lacus]
MPLLFRRLTPLLPALLVLLAIIMAQSAKADFVPGTEDVPLAPGLTAMADDALVFDNPTGRIVQATATGSTNADAVTRYYTDTLPQLGWVRGSDGRWTRSGEVLDIAIATDATTRRLTVRFQLSPRAER